MKNILKWCFKNITSRYPGTILILAALLGGAALLTASRLEYDSRLDNLLPEDLELVQDFNRVLDKTGGGSRLVIVLEGLDQNQAPKVIQQLARRLEGVPGIHYVDHRIPKDFLNNRQLLLVPKKDLETLLPLLDDAVDHAKSQFTGFFGTTTEPYNPRKLQTLADDYKIFEDIPQFYKGKNRGHYFMFLQPQGTSFDTDFTENFVRAVKTQITLSGLERSHPGLKINLTGSMITRLEENKTILRDLKRAVALAACLATFIVVIYTRSVFSLVLIFFPLALSLSYTFALTRLIIGHINIISGFLMAILMGLGVDYGIHLYIRFKQELLKGKPTFQAVELVTTQVGRSGVVAMFTTISVFSLLIFSDFRGFSEYGTIAALGIFSAFITYFFLFPAQVLFSDKIHWLRKPRPRMFSLNISNLYSNTPYFLSALFLLVMAASLVLVPNVEFEYDFQKLRGDSPAADYETQTSRDFGFAFSPTVLMTSKKEDLFAIHQALENIKNKYGSDSTISMVHSLNLFSPSEYKSKKDVLKKISRKLIREKNILELSMGTTRYDHLRRLVESPPFNESKVPESLIRRFTAEDQYLVLIFSPSDKNYFDVRNIYQLQKEMNELKTVLAKSNVSVSVLNENLLAAEILDWVKQKGPLALVFALLLVFVILVFDFRSFSLALKTFLPLFTGLALTGALMSIFNVKLNFINIVMLPSIVGIMIDHCIYLGHHIQDYSEGQTIKSLKETGSAILLSALTTLAGYTSLNVANHAGIRSIAAVVELGIITCTLCALFMLPALFELGHHKLAFNRSRKTRPKD